MYVYWVIWFLICLANFLTTYKKGYSRLFYFLFFIFLFCFVSFRYKVGADWYNYITIYDNHKFSNFNDIVFNAEPLFHLFNLIGHYFNFQDTILVNFLCGIVVFFSLWKVFLNLKYYWLALLIYFPYHLLVVSMGYNRQAVAIAIFMLSVIKLVERKLISFVFLVFIASLFHQTAIVFLILAPILFFNNIKSKIYLLYKILSIFIILFAIYYFSLKDANIYLSTDGEMSSKGFLIRWLYHLIPILIFLQNIEYFKKSKDYIFLNYLFVLIVLIFFIGFVFSTFADRFNLYLIIFDLIVMTKFFCDLNYGNRLILILILIFFYTVSIYLWMYNGEWAMKSWLPYRNYIYDYFSKGVF